MSLLSGYIIPKGWKVLTWFRNVHLDPEIYPDPKKFDPSRWEVRRDKHSTMKCLCNCIWWCRLLYVKSIWTLSGSFYRDTHQKQAHSFLLVWEATYARETILPSSRFPFFFIISSSNTGNFLSLCI